MNYQDINLYTNFSLAEKLTNVCFLDRYYSIGAQHFSDMHNKFKLSEYNIEKHNKSSQNRRILS